jgi:hypothetical protein
MDEATGQGKSRPSETAYPRRQTRPRHRDGAGAPHDGRDKRPEVPREARIQPRREFPANKSKRKKANESKSVFPNRDISKGYG